MIDSLPKLKIWRYFQEISNIPRPSKHEGKIIEYLLDFALEKGLEYKKDHVGNVVIFKNATSSMMKAPPVVLQGHVDMVCEKNDGIKFDFFNDPLRLCEDNGYVRAEGTTLGADNGIGVAAALAVLDSDDVEHGPLECLFTVDEETGLTGANELTRDFIKGRKLLNLDAVDSGDIYIGCAGGVSTRLNKKNIDIISCHHDSACKLHLYGLKGGHSGIEIGKGHANALKLLARALWNISDNYDIGLTFFKGGDKHNAIPREASSLITFNSKDRSGIENLISELSEDFKNEFRGVETNLSLKMSETDIPHDVLDPDETGNFIAAIYSLPHGVCSMSREIEGLIESSTNLAAAGISREGLNVLTSQRSSIDSSVTDISSRITALGKLAGYDSVRGDPYPAWTPDTSSELLKKAVESHRKIMGKKPGVKAVHAGLECGLIGEKYPGIEMISFGPDIHGAHSPDESVNINSVTVFWNILTDILSGLNK